MIRNKSSFYKQSLLLYYIKKIVTNQFRKKTISGQIGIKIQQRNNKYFKQLQKLSQIIQFSQKIIQMKNHNHSSDDSQSTSFQSQFNSMQLNSFQDEKDNKQSQLHQPLVSFKYHPGFFCFFQKYVEQKGWTFYQCYNKVFQSHHQMMKIRRKTEDIVMDSSLNKDQKLQELSKRAQKDTNLIYYTRTEDPSILQGAMVVNESQRLKKINQLQQQLKKLQGLKQRVIKSKKSQFQKRRLQKTKQQQKQIQNIQNEKIRRAQLVRQIQKQSQQRQKNRQHHNSFCNLM